MDLNEKQKIEFWGFVRLFALIIVAGLLVWITTLAIGTDRKIENVEAVRQVKEKLHDAAVILYGSVAEPMQRSNEI